MKNLKLNLFIWMSIENYFSCQFDLRNIVLYIRASYFTSLKCSVELNSCMELIFLIRAIKIIRLKYTCTIFCCFKISLVKRFYSNLLVILKIEEDKYNWFSHLYLAWVVSLFNASFCCVRTELFVHTAEDALSPLTYFGNGSSCRN